MTGLDKIKDKLILEAREHEKNVLALFEKERGRIEETYKARANEAKREILEKAKAEVEKISFGAESTASQKRRNELLATKVELIDSAFEKAADELASYDDEKYVSIMGHVLAAAVCENFRDSKKCRIIFGNEDARLAQKIIDKASNDEKKIDRELKFEVSDETFDGRGFKINDGDIGANCTLGVLVGSLRDKCEGEVARILFGK